MQEVTILGLKINQVSVVDTLGFIEKAITERTVSHIVTADASMVVLAREDPELLDIVNNAELVTADGSGILWASKLLGKGLNERVSGVDLVAHLCRLSAEPAKGYRIYFLGAAPGVAVKAAENLILNYPGAQIVGTRNGYFKPEEEQGVVDAIKEAKADALLVAFGIPKQEKFIRRYRDELGVPVMIGIGGSFDVYSGLVKRAPIWMQKAGIEWIYRLCQNPKKISKVMTLPIFAMLAMKARLSGKS